MCFGTIPARELVHAFEVSLILYAEHSFNASTFAARVVTSTLPDIYSAVTAAIGALEGPLHGGANEAVMRHMIEIGDPALAGAVVARQAGQEEKVMVSATASTRTVTPGCPP
jgi:citrate synthase